MLWALLVMELMIFKFNCGNFHEIDLDHGWNWIRVFGQGRIQVGRPSFGWFEGWLGVDWSFLLRLVLWFLMNF